LYEPADSTIVDPLDHPIIIAEGPARAAQQHLNAPGEGWILYARNVPPTQASQGKQCCDSPIGYNVDLILTTGPAT
jgi:hypothetical protein